jgi:hypothetical protein
MPALTATLRARHGFVSLVIAGLAVLSSPMSGGRASTTASADSHLVQHRAATARTTYLSETANLHLVAHQGTQILHEEGQASGTLRGRLTAVLNIAYTQATVTFTARSSGGTLTGRGIESYYVSGKNGHFSGRMIITGGTGRYAHASASALQTTGLIKRAHYELTMTVSGQLKS